MIYRAFLPDAAEANGAIFVRAMEIWNTVCRNFSPLIGEVSVRMIFARSLDLVRPAYPWLERASIRHEGESLDFLSQRIQAREPAEAMDACRALLSAYCDILDALIGARLTSRWLTASLAPPSAKEMLHGR